MAKRKIVKKINARQKGHAYERKIAEEFRQLGYDKCLTSRLESKKRDDEKVDLCHTGNWNIQCKAVEKLGRYHDILDTMPVEEENINVIFHKINRKGEVVAMRKEDFYRIILRLDKLEKELDQNLDKLFQ